MSKFYSEDIKFTFDDVIIVPTYSEVASRSETYVDTSVMLGKHKFKIPIIASNMDTISDMKMLLELAKLGGLGIMHRYMSVEDTKARILEWAKLGQFEAGHPLALSVGSIDNVMERQRIDMILKDPERFWSDDQIILCVDLAHGDSAHMVKSVKALRKDYGFTGAIIAGNTATKEGTARLIDAGADIVRCGVGGGCLGAGTRILMSNGTYKDIQDITLNDQVINMHGKPVKVIGVKNSGKKRVMKYRSNIFHKDTYVTPSHEHWVGDFSDIKDINSRGIKGVLSRPSKGGSSRIKWLPTEECEKANWLVPSKIDFDIKDNFEINLIDFMQSQRNFEGAIKAGIIKPSYNLGYVFGTFLGAGCAKMTFTKRAGGKRNTCGENSWSFSKHETDIANKLVAALKSVFDTDAKIVPRDNVLMVINRNNFITRLLLEFGKRDNKHLPEKYFCSNKDYLKGIYDGLVDSDGSVDGAREGVSNTSTRLIELMGILGIILNGYFPSVSIKKPSAGKLKGCNVDNCKPGYAARTVARPDFMLMDNFQIVRNYGIEHTDLVIDTFDIEVDCPSHSFVANNTIVHNSACTTRVKTGCGMPQLSAVLDSSEAGAIISDGGHKLPSDCAKAIAAGAKFVMLGGMLAGTDCTPHWDEAMAHHEKSLKFGATGDLPEVAYRGMASKEAREAFSGIGKNAEGAAFRLKIKPKGSTREVVEHIMEGIRSAMSYTNSTTIDQFVQNAKFVRVTPTTIQENASHFGSKSK